MCGGDFRKRNLKMEWMDAGKISAWGKSTRWCRWRPRERGAPELQTTLPPSHLYNTETCTRGLHSHLHTASHSYRLRDNSSNQKAPRKSYTELWHQFKNAIIFFINCIEALSRKQTHHLLLKISMIRGKKPRKRKSQETFETRECLSLQPFPYLLLHPKPKWIVWFHEVHYLEPKNNSVCSLDSARRVIMDLGFSL